MQSSEEAGRAELWNQCNLEPCVESWEVGEDRADDKLRVSRRRVRNSLRITCLKQ